MTPQIVEDGHARVDRTDEGLDLVITIYPPWDEGNALAAVASLTSDEARALAIKLAGWESIESAPRDGSGVLVCESDEEGDYCGVAVVAYEQGQWVDTIDGEYILHPTHWMLLPAPPHLPTGEQP